MGPVLVLAGPGAGKTYCLIERIAYLLRSKGLDPRRVCAVTFTNKAAEEVAVRLRSTLGDDAEHVTRGTLHALCVDLLRRHGQAVGIPPEFGIADEPYQLLVLSRLNVRPEPRRRGLLSAFSRRRFQDHELIAEDEAMFRAYEDYLVARQLLDFDQLVLRSADLFQRQPDVASEVAGRWDYVLVDEFQDLDRVQYAVLKVIVSPHRNLFAVGDDEQSIFSWRGADPSVLRTFADEFGVEPIVLDHNRRCSVQIFESARRLLAAAPSLFDKELRAVRHSPFAVEAYAFTQDDDETNWIIDDIRTDREAHGLEWGDYGLLYRRHDVGHALEAALLRAGIPCRLARGRALQDDEVVRYVVSALQLMRFPEDPLRVERFAAEVLPGTLCERLQILQAEGERTFLDAARAFGRSNPRTDPDTKKAWRFVYQTENLRTFPEIHDTLDSVIDALLSQRVGPYKNLLEEYHDELSDPADHPDAVALADALAGALHGQRRVWVDRPGPVRVALSGMLLKAGVTIVRYRLPRDDVAADDVVVSDDPLTLFKALQLVHSRDFTDRFRDYVAFDLETTDKDPETCEIVELGAVRVRAGEIVDRFRSLVRPNGRVSAGAEATHGYSNADLQTEPRLAEVWPRFRAFVGSDVLVAHNGMRFDVPVLRRLAEPLGGVGDLRFFDSLVLAHTLFRTGAALGTLATRFGVTIGHAHHALDDAEMLAGVFGALNRARVVRARKATLVELLEYLGLGLALDGEMPLSAEGKLLKARTAFYALSRYAECLDYYDEERRRLEEPDLPTREEVIELLGGRRRYERLQTERTPEQRYPEAVARLRSVLAASHAETVSQSIDRFLEHVALSTSQGAEVDGHRVNLLTLHATKGLEFSRVYVVGVEDHEIPGYRAVSRSLQAEIEEARRLLYVGMTRARDRLVLTRVSGRRGQDGGRNRFLDEMGIIPRRP